MRTGDTVKHGPSGETWTVAYVKEGYLAWVGWPMGDAKVEDCTLIESCTDEEHDKLLRELADMKPDRQHDPRQSYAQAELERTDALYAFKKVERLKADVSTKYDELQRACRRLEEAEQVWMDLYEKSPLCVS